MKSATLTVTGMSCDHCVTAIEGALKSAGVSGKVDLTQKTVQVDYDETKVELNVVKNVIENQGYEVQ